MRILILGATGFIGRNLALYYQNKPGITLTLHRFSRPAYHVDNAEWVQGDLTNKAFVEHIVKGQDVIIQAAAVTSGAGDIINRPHIHVTDNAIMNSLVLRAAHDFGVGHFVFFSCTVMYQNSDVALKESDFDATNPLYERYFGVGWTKVYIEKMCEFYAGLGSLKTTAIRHSNIYGPYDKFDLAKSHVMGATITKVMQASDPGNITMWGEGKELRDVLYVDDLIECVDKVVERQREPYRLYNCGSGKMHSVRALVDAIIRASGKKIQVEIDTTKPSLATGLCLNCDRAKAELGWQPHVDLEEGLAKTLTWWRNNPIPL